MTRQTQTLLGGGAGSAVLLFVLPHIASAHGHQPPWLDPTTLDDGWHVVVQHPRVIRAPGPLTINVGVRNIAGQHDATIDSIRYVVPTENIVEQHHVDRILPTRRAAFEQYRVAAAEMHELAHREDADAVRRAARRCRTLLQELTAEVVTDHYHLPADHVPADVGSSFRMTVEIELTENSHRRVIRRPISIPVWPSLPSGAAQASIWSYDARTGTVTAREQSSGLRGTADTVAWYAGDQHLHTTYSLDALILDGTVADVTDYAATAESIGLNWIIITDHSNVHYTHQGTEYYTPQQFDEGTAQAAAYTATNSLVALYGEEMGAGRAGLFALPSHYLAYPFASASTGYLANPSSGLIYGLANCEDEQVIVDRVNNAGGFGFIAHPFDSGLLAFAEWDFDNGVTGWSGLEIWSDTNGEIKSTDDEAVEKWHDLLNSIPAPQQGTLGDRPGFPNAFPVGLGNSDAHQPGLIGATFTYAWMPAVSQAEVVDALSGGRCVASNGPLLYGELNGGRIGEVALLLDGDNDLSLNLATTAEFGPVGDYTLTVLVNGVARATVPPTGDPGFSMSVLLADLDLSAPDKFVTLRADSAGGVFHAIANPIWLQFTDPGDANADGLVTLTDAREFAECLTGPNEQHLPSCDLMDFNRDRDVDLSDFAEFQTAFDGT